MLTFAVRGAVHLGYATLVRYREILFHEAFLPLICNIFLSPVLRNHSSLGFSFPRITLKAILLHHLSTLGVSIVSEYTS